MKDRIKEAFAQIQAEEELKNKTKAYLMQKTHGYTKAAGLRPYIYAAACMCILLFLVGGRRLYYTPTSEISIDVNPSLELSVNRFDRVISVHGMNEDGQKFANTLNIRNKKYQDAINQILESNDISILLSNEEILTITVICSDDIQSAEILSEIEGCTAHKKNVYCYYSQSKEVEAAHEAGLSYGKYRAFLELQKLDPDITPEEIQNMTMREIRDYMASLSSGDMDGILPSGNGCGRHRGRNGNGDGMGCK